MRLVDLQENETISYKDTGMEEMIIRKQFGDILFGDWQYKKRLRPEREKDTKYESAVFKEIQRWFGGGMASADIQKTIEYMSKMKKYYPELLKPDSMSRIPKLYRGIPRTAVNWEEQTKYSEFDRNIEIKSRDPDIEEDKIIQNYRLVKTKKDITYKPFRMAESWTISIRSAIDIMVNHFWSDPKSVIIYEAVVPDEERLFKIKFSNKMFPTKQYEVVRVSNKPIKATAYLIEYIKNEIN